MENAADNNSILENVTVEEKADETKENKSEVLLSQFKKMKNTIQQLDNSIAEAQHNDHQLIVNLQSDDLKNQKLSSQLEQARKENKQLMNIIQQRCSETNRVSRSSSASSFSTVSMVHLQYKYEELLTSHEGLLKVLESRLKETKEYQKENEKLCEEIKKLRCQMADYQQNLLSVRDKYISLKKRKDNKINRLKSELHTLKMVHGQLVKILNEQCMERDGLLDGMLEHTRSPKKALLVQEIRKTNKLQHENTILRQQLALLQINYSNVMEAKDKSR